MLREEYNDAEESDLILQESTKASIWTAIPAIIQSVDYSKFTVSAQPAIQGVITDKENDESYQDLPMLVDVPILFPQAGGWHMTFPVQEGDECLIVFASRCIDAWWQSGGIQKPMESRMLDLSDGFAILAPYSQPKAKQVAGGFSSSSVILRDSGKQNFLELTNDGNANLTIQGSLNADVKQNLQAKVSGNAEVNVAGNTTATIGGALKASANSITLSAANVTIDAPQTTITGGLSIQGSTQANGAINCNSDVTAAGISLKSHIHGGVQGGPSKTSGPE